MMNVEGTTVVDNGTGERYQFQTKKFAYSFAGIWNKYEMDKLCSSGYTSTITFNDPQYSITRCFQINLGENSYSLNMGKPPTIRTKILLWLLGFKRL